MENENILKITNLRKIFDNKLILDDVTLTVKQGDFVAIIGASGFGKSTLLNCIHGSVGKNDGSILFDGTSISDMKDAELSRMRNTELAYIRQGYDLLPNLNIIENIKAPMLFGAKLSDKLDDIIDSLRIREVLNKYPNQISGGESKRVMIARGMAVEPKAILADEPTADLDPENAKMIVSCLRDYASTHAVVMVTHDMSNINMCTHVYKLYDGILTKVK